MLLGGDKCSLQLQLPPVLMVMHLQEEPPEPLNEYAQGRVDRITFNQARMAASGLGAMGDELASDQPAAKKGRKRRKGQENIPKVLCSCGCGANACCAQSQHKWPPPISLLLMQPRAKLQQLCLATQTPLPCRQFQPLIAHCAGRRGLSLTLRPQLQRQQRWSRHQLSQPMHK